MNIKFQRLNPGLLGVVLVGLAQLPTNAQTAIVQSSTQQSNITGNNNQVYQTINQTIYYHPGRGSVNRTRDPKLKPRFSSSFSDDDDDRRRERREVRCKHSCERETFDDD